MSAFLGCRDLAKRFDDVEAVRAGTLELARGELVALVGPSGCGKTTLLRLIAGFDVPDAGEIRLDGRLLAGPGTFVPPERRRVGMVFQDYALFPHLSVEANVGFALGRRRDGRERAAALLDLVGLRGTGARMPHELSGGQQQRVALARALAAEPDVILLDEPFSNLDPALRVRVRAEVRDILRSLGTTAIIVTHDQEEALSLAGRVAVMLDGAVLQVGAPAEVYRRPVSRDVAAFVGEANFLSGRARDGTVDCELGPVPVAEAPAGPVELMIRPEHLVLSADSGVPVEPVGREFYGHDQVVTARLPSGAVVRVRLTPGEEPASAERLFVRVRSGALALATRR
ncbi:MAG TPA: ABC transporter ATP-binding protein [Actinomycetota bacterium]|nr:ABC transporter ATP-binding protein [Actinomycetota bacterium]